MTAGRFNRVILAGLREAGVTAQEFERALGWYAAAMETCLDEVSSQNIDGDDVAGVMTLPRGTSAMYNLDFLRRIETTLVGLVDRLHGADTSLPLEVSCLAEKLVLFGVLGHLAEPPEPDPVAAQPLVARPWADHRRALLSVLLDDADFLTLYDEDDSHVYGPKAEQWDAWLGRPPLAFEHWFDDLCVDLEDDDEEGHGPVQEMPPRW